MALYLMLFHSVLMAMSFAAMVGAIMSNESGLSSVCAGVGLVNLTMVAYHLVRIAIAWG